MEGKVKRTWWRIMGQFVWTLTTSMARHDIASLAAVIAFYAFFSLFPLLLLIIYAISLLLPNTHTEQLLIGMLRPYFPALHETKKFITENVSHLAESGARVGLLSAIILTWSATSGFIAVQQALDVIWEWPQQRSYIVRRLIGFATLLVLLIFTLLSAIVTAVYPVFRRSIFARAEFLHWAVVIHGFSREFFPISLFIAFLVLYRFLASKPIPWIWAFPGALVAAVALDAGRQIFVWYGSHLLTYQVIYGGLTAVMLIVLWMYIGSMVMLFGAEVAAALQKTVPLIKDDA